MTLPGVRRPSRPGSGRCGRGGRIERVAQDRHGRFHHRPGGPLGNGPGCVHGAAHAAGRRARDRSHRIEVVAAPVGDAYVNPLNGGQITGTSNSIQDAWEKLRTAGAQARLDADRRGRAEDGASIRGNAAPPSGRVTNARGRFPALRRSRRSAAAKLPVPKDVKLKDRGGLSAHRQAASLASTRRPRSTARPSSDWT